MSNLIRPSVTRTARKPHRCIVCYWPIAVGEQYVEQTGYWEGSAFRNKFHAECFEDLCDEGGGEFTPGCGEPPERLREAALAARSKPTPRCTCLTGQLGPDYCEVHAA
ncbi:MAG: hypothetical protein ACK52I_19235 [Pseudomonadota bacterium]